MILTDKETETLALLDEARDILGDNCTNLTLRKLLFILKDMKSILDNHYSLEILRETIKAYSLIDSRLFYVTSYGEIVEYIVNHIEIRFNCVVLVCTYRNSDIVGYAEIKVSDIGSKVFVNVDEAKRCATMR